METTHFYETLMDPRLITHFQNPDCYNSKFNRRQELKFDYLQFIYFLLYNERARLKTLYRVFLSNPRAGQLYRIEFLHHPAHASTADVLTAINETHCIKHISVLYLHEEQTSFTTVTLVVDNPGSR